MATRPSSVHLDEATGHQPAGRPRLAWYRFRRTPSGRCRCQVALSWGEQSPVAGVAEGVCSPSGELRCAAEACLEALRRGMPEGRLELLGVKTLRAFDSTLVVAAVAIRGGTGGPRLVGSVLAGRDPVPAAARAVLHAVNRVITRPSPAPGNGNGDSGI